MKIDQKKLERQQECLRNWRSNKYKGTIVAATGFGKTYMGILAIKELLYRYDKLNKIPAVNIVVPTDYLRTQWSELLQSFDLSSYCRVNVINSWINEGKNSCDMLILDEIHGYTGGDVWSEIFEYMTYTQILGLTAKERDKEGDHATLNRNAPIVDRVTIKECLVNGWIAPFTIYNLGIELNTKDRAYYNSIHKKFIKYFSTFDFSLSKMFNCLSDKQAREVLAREMNWEEKMVMVHASQANRIMQQRKKWLYTYPALYDKTEELIKLFPEKRIITFSQVTSSVDLLEDRIPNSVAYHSAVRTKVYKDYDKDTDEGTLVAVANKVYNSTTKKNVTMYTFEGTNYHWKDLKKIIDGKLTRISGDKQKQLALKEFLSGKANVIHSASALNEGVDIPGLDMSIKTSFNSTIIDSIQRTGRTARIDNNNSDKRAIEVNLYIKDTQSERWLKNSQKETPNVQWIDSVKDVI